MFHLIHSQIEESIVGAGTVFCITSSDSLLYLRFLASQMRESGIQGGFWIDDKDGCIEEL
jgi:hypothetical protein